MKVSNRKRVFFFSLTCLLLKPCGLQHLEKNHKKWNFDKQTVEQEKLTDRCWAQNYSSMPYRTFKKKCMHFCFSNTNFSDIHHPLNLPLTSHSRFQTRYIFKTSCNDRGTDSDQQGY